MIYKYGDPPVDLGEFKIPPSEMMFYLYLPIKMPSGIMSLPRRLSCFSQMIAAVQADSEYEDWVNSYCYITAKSMFVSKGSPGNRPGWHVDGFGSHGDKNYIWYDMNPTEFAVQEFGYIPEDDSLSMVEMERQVDNEKIRTWPNRKLLRLHEGVVHRVNKTPAHGHRTFVKITTSKHAFTKQGNSKNHLLDYNWELSPRQSKRNLDHG